MLGYCSICKKPFCRECLTEADDFYFCAEHRQKRNSKNRHVDLGARFNNPIEEFLAGPKKGEIMEQFFVAFNPFRRSYFLFYLIWYCFSLMVAFSKALVGVISSTDGVDTRNTPGWRAFSRISKQFVGIFRIFFKHDPNDANHDRKVKNP